MKTLIPFSDILTYLPSFTRFQWGRTEKELLNERRLIQQCIIENSLMPLYRRTEEFLDRDGYKQLLECFAALRLKLADEYEIDVVDRSMEQNRFEIAHTLFQRDPSNPIRHLMHNATETWFFYSLEMNIDPTMISDEADRWIEREHIKRVLGIVECPNEHNNRLLEELIDNSHLGGELRIYFRAPLFNLIKENADFNVVHILGPEVFIAVVNSKERTGYDITLPMDLTIPFIRKDLYFDQAMHYSYIDDLHSKDIEHWNDNTSFIPLVKYSGD